MYTKTLKTFSYYLSEALAAMFNNFINESVSNNALKLLKSIQFTKLEVNKILIIIGQFL